MANVKSNFAKAKMFKAILKYFEAIFLILLI